MAKFTAAHFDEWIGGYEQDRLGALEKVKRVGNVLKLMEGPGNEPYRTRTIELRHQLENDVMLYDRLIADYKRWKAEP